jgi:hypothetical protein
LDDLHRNGALRRLRLGIIGSGALPTIQRHAAGLDQHLAIVKINSIPLQPHDFGAAQPAERQPPTGSPLVLISDCPELIKLGRRPRLIFRLGVNLGLAALLAG